MIEIRTIDIGDPDKFQANEILNGHDVGSRWRDKSGILSVLTKEEKVPGADGMLDLVNGMGEGDRGYLLRSGGNVLKEVLAEAGRRSLSLRSKAVDDRTLIVMDSAAFVDQNKGRGI